MVETPVYDLEGKRIGTARGLQTTVSRGGGIPEVRLWAREIEFDAGSMQAVFNTLQIAVQVEELEGDLYPFTLKVQISRGNRFANVTGVASGNPI
jgi:hypothetical protein